MLKNTISAPIKDGVISDNFTWSSNKISTAVNSAIESIPDLIIDDDTVSDSTTWSSEKIDSLFAPSEDENEGE